MPKIALETIPASNGTPYPAEFAGPFAGRWTRRVGSAAKFEDFGVSHVTLEPGAQSSQRHWHEQEDEFVVVLSGTATLVDDTGRTLMVPGDMAVFPKNDGNGHMLVNEGDQPCTLVAVGAHGRGDCHYPDIDMHLFHGKGWRRKDGTEFPEQE
ncbi:cupin domain-containing protein [Novosphingobium pentaromativorans]|uniref:Cupin 2 conserved barrel domain protein n=1 Tax=Novosphingobium pentaromativorans US6-1 TaxID=1088721 RepID=G6EGA1_9SPHN|nr:cupin domain-containing protein [Novosphingobium pentaromativorans]AIT82213.1 transcriptional regulator [Novosphingobium pentaromativorans US6-1]EHJ59790.1 Cupin 2 conserved barrel domain protein [Novosphingobium pentaromativorans US6-1]